MDRRDLDALWEVGLGADADLEEVADGVHGLDEPGFRGLLRPEECFCVRLRQNAGRSNKVPRC